MMVKVFLAIAALLAGLSVALGAFASHGLKDKLTERALEIFETATRYQMYHALGLMLVAVLLIQSNYSGTRFRFPKALAATYSVQEYSPEL